MFADSSAFEVQNRVQTTDIEYSIPILKELIKEGPFHHPRLFLINGKPQTYKTTLATEIIRPFLDESVSGSEAIWMDCDLKFPLDVLMLKSVNLGRLHVCKCRSSEDIYVSLLQIEHQIIHSDLSNIRAVVIDGVNSSFWIDNATGQLSKKHIRWLIKDIVEKLVTMHGLTVIVVLAYLGDFEVWRTSDFVPNLRLYLSKKDEFSGELSCSTFSDKFKIGDNREFIWGKRSLAPITELPVLPEDQTDEQNLQYVIGQELEE